jgi:hypothetical protein
VLIVSLGEKSAKKKPQRCHSERSEESLFGVDIGTERFFASLRMTKIGITAAR